MGQDLIDMSYGTNATVFYAFVILAICQIYWLNSFFKKALRAFEKDADNYDLRLRQEGGDEAAG